MDLIYHYTTFDIFKRLLKQQAILPDRSETQNEKEIPTVTFSAHPEWEPTRYRVGRLPNGQVILLNKMLLQQFCGGLIRIGVKPEVAPMNWYTMKDRVGMSSAAMKGIYDFAISVGARTSHWFGTFEDVPDDLWVSVQILKNDQWRDIEDSDLPNLEDVDLTQPVGVVNIKFDKPASVDVSSLHEVFDDSGVEAL